MLLRNQGMYRELLQVEVDSGERQRIHLAEGQDRQSDGIFFDHKETLFGLGTESGDLFLVLGDQLVECDANITTTLEASPDSSTFTASRGTVRLCSVAYSPIKASGWIPNEDDECLDGFLWIHNVLSSAERRAIIIEGGSGAHSKNIG